MTQTAPTTATRVRRAPPTSHLSRRSRPSSPCARSCRLVQHHRRRASPFTLQMFGIFLARSRARREARRPRCAPLPRRRHGRRPDLRRPPGRPVRVDRRIRRLPHRVPDRRVLRRHLSPAASPVAIRLLSAVVISIAAAIVTVGVVGVIGAIGMSIKLKVGLKVAWGYATPFFVFDIIKGVVAGDRRRRGAPRVPAAGQALRHPARRGRRLRLDAATATSHCFTRRPSRSPSTASR